jgi:hypothetical protein
MGYLARKNVSYLKLPNGFPYNIILGIYINICRENFNLVSIKENLHKI